MIAIDMLDDFVGFMVVLSGELILILIDAGSDLDHVEGG